MKAFKFLHRTYHGKALTVQEVKKLGLPADTTIQANNFEELRRFPPNIVIAECVKNRVFNQDKSRQQSLKKKQKYGMGLGVYQQLWFDEYLNVKVLKPSNIKFKNMYRPYTGQNLDNKTLLVIRTGGIGDLLFIQPNLRHLKEIYPTCQITFACGPQYQTMVETWDCIDTVVDLPISFPHILRADFHAIFEGVIERCILAHTTNAYRLFTEWLGLDLPDEKLVPVQTPKEDKVEECLDILESVGAKPKKFILLQLRASSPIRTPRPEFWKKVVDKLTDKDHTIFITDAPYMAEQVGDFIKTLNKPLRVHNFAHDSETLDYTIALASLARCVVSTDTSLLHVAASMGIPGFGFYGPFPGEVRLTTYKNIHWVNSKESCAPCFLHGPTPCKNATNGHSICYDSIDIDESIRRIEELIND